MERGGAGHLCVCMRCLRLPPKHRLWQRRTSGSTLTAAAAAPKSETPEAAYTCGHGWTEHDSE